MAFSAHKSTAMMEELNDSPAEFEEHVAQVAALMQSSRKTVFFTGAGISTSAGIPDYRGPQGVWTLAANGGTRTLPTVDMMKAYPTGTHMAMVELVRRGLLSFVVSQNVDGIHRKSGIPPANISELHGNSNIEYCERCGRRYLRDYHVHSMGNDHATGRCCDLPGCGGTLRDNIINFGENLEPAVLNKAFVESQAADLHICLGSSLTVRPACELPRTTKDCGGKVVIVNLQRTPLDNICDVRVHAPVDAFMAAVMQKLGLAIPAFRVQRQLVVWRDPDTVRLCGMEADGLPSSIVRYITVMKQKSKGSDVPLTVKGVATAMEEVHVNCEFFGHYNEPHADIVLPAGKQCVRVSLSIDPMHDHSWTVNSVEDALPPSLATPEPLPSALVIREAPSLPQAQDFAGWHAVCPIDDCEHTKHLRFNNGQVLDLRAPCANSDCGHVGENMICLTCGVVLCGRHVNSHMLAHNTETSHPIVCGMIDLSFWCYPCEAYINPSNPKVRQYYRALHLAKFGCVPFA